MKKWLALLFVIALAAIAWRCVLFVDETQFVIVTQFGRPIETLAKAGPYFKLPYQSSLAIDRRMQIYNPRPSEFLTSEKKNVDLDVYVLWSVEDPQHFIETVNDPGGAESRIHDIVWSKLAAAVSRNSLDRLVTTEATSHGLEQLVHEVEDVVWSKLAAAVSRKSLNRLVTTEAKSHGLEQLVHEVESDCAAEVQEKYGIKIVDVRIKRIGLPDQIRESVFERMRKERARIAQRYRSEGTEEAMKIRAAADKEKTVILASANAEAEIIRGKAEAQATRTYSEAHGKDPQFFELTRTLDAYKKILDEKTTVLLSGDSELLKYLSRGPGDGKKN